MLHNFIPCAIASGGTISTVAYSQGLRLAGVFADNNFSGNSMTLQAIGPNGITGRPSSVSGGTFTLTISAGGFASIPKDIGAPINQVQFVSGTTQSGATSKLTAVFVDI